MDYSGDVVLRVTVPESLEGGPAVTQTGNMNRGHNVNPVVVRQVERRVVQ